MLSVVIFDSTQTHGSSKYLLSLQKIEHKYERTNEKLGKGQTTTITRKLQNNFMVVSTASPSQDTPLIIKYPKPNKDSESNDLKFNLFSIFSSILFSSVASRT